MDYFVMGLFWVWAILEEGYFWPTFIAVVVVIIVVVFTAVTNNGKNITHGSHFNGSYNAPSTLAQGYQPYFINLRHSCVRDRHVCGK